MHLLLTFPAKMLRHTAVACALLAAPFAEAPAFADTLLHPGINFRAPTKCVPSSLIKVLKRVSARYGPITVNSTWRGRSKNRKVGGRGHSMHLACRAVDFRVHGSTRGLLKFLMAQKEVGGFNRYPSGFYHIDNGPRRTW